MRKQAAKIGIVAVILAVGCATPAYDRVVSSAQTLHRCIEGLKAGNATLSPLDRLVFSLVTANSRPAHRRGPATAPSRQT